MDFWRENIDRIIEFNDKKVLKGNGSVSNEQMKTIVRKVYDEFEVKRKQYDAQQADLEDLKEIEELEAHIKLLK